MIALVLSFVLHPQNNETLSYHNRWVWGVVFACIVVFLAIQMTGLAEQRLNNPQGPGFLFREAHNMQSRMVEKLGLLQLPDAGKSVLATITVNYRKAMTRELRNQFSITGVSHLLAVSGFHVGIVCAFVNAALSFFPRRGFVVHWMKYLATMLCVWAFTYITGLTTAAVRAAVMLTIYMTGRVLKRDPDKYNTLAGAAFCMLVYNPFYLFDVGFQLSFVAVFFILYLQPRLNRLIEIRNPVIATPWNVLTVTIAAQIGSGFLCFFYFGQSSMVFLFTNLFLSLLATILIPATLLWMIMPVWTPGMDLLRSVVETMTRCLMWIVDRFSSIPGATLSVRFDFFTLVFSYLCLTFILVYFRLRHYWMLFASLATLLLMLCWHLV
ncbi:MAG: ComEC/Rec2 family competence protein [Tannerella sp.]|nr:ComEC/Rec2 family competence protein [Tannerella sp.]